MQERFERFSFAMLEIYRHWHAIAGEEMKPYGLKVLHALILLTMQHFPEGITAAQLTELCGRDKADTSRALALLARKKLLIREDSPSGGYRALWRMSEAGEKAAASLRRRARLAVALGGRGITPASRDVFYETLELIAYNLQTLHQAGLPEEESAPAVPDGRTEPS